MTWWNPFRFIREIHEIRKVLLDPPGQRNFFLINREEMVQNADSYVSKLAHEDEATATLFMKEYNGEPCDVFIDKGQIRKRFFKNVMNELKPVIEPSQDRIAKAALNELQRHQTELQTDIQRKADIQFQEDIRKQHPLLLGLSVPGVEP